MPYVIYKATNKINRKSYIGFDSNWPARMRQHKHHANKNTGHYFHNSLIKHGFENFYWEVLYESDDKKFVRDAEIFYINFFQTFGPRGYNLTAGGDGLVGLKHKDETKEKISKNKKDNPTKFWLGKSRDDATKEKFSIAAKLRVQSIQQKKRNSDAITLKWQDPIWRTKVLEARKRNKSA